MKGFATMYMRMPMSQSAMPISGSVDVDGKDVTLKFQNNSIGFKLPAKPSRGMTECELKMSTSGGGVVNIVLHYIDQLEAFHGVGRVEGDDNPIVHFTFYDKDSRMTRLPTY